VRGLSCGGAQCDAAWLPLVRGGQGRELPLIGREFFVTQFFGRLRTPNARNSAGKPTLTQTL